MEQITVTFHYITSQKEHLINAIIVICFFIWRIFLIRGLIKLLKFSNLRGCFHFCYPFILDPLFVMVIFYRFSIWRIKKAKELVFFFVIHILICVIPNSSTGDCCNFRKISSSSKPFKEWTSRNLGIYPHSNSFVYRFPCETRYELVKIVKPRYWYDHNNNIIRIGYPIYKMNIKILEINIINIFQHWCYK